MWFEEISTFFPGKVNKSSKGKDNFKKQSKILNWKFQRGGEVQPKIIDVIVLMDVGVQV